MERGELNTHTGKTYLGLWVLAARGQRLKEKFWWVVFTGEGFLGGEAVVVTGECYKQMVMVCRE